MINYEEQTVLETRKDAFEGENTQTEYSVLGYRIDLYFHDHELAIGNDELDHKHRDVNYEIQGQKTIEKQLGCKFVGINADEQNVNIFKAINKMQRHIKESPKKIFNRQDFKEISEIRIQVRLFNKIKMFEVCCQKNIVIIIKP